MNKLLASQLEEVFGQADVPAGLEPLLARIDETYASTESEREALERTLSFSTRELDNRFHQLASGLEVRRRAEQALKDSERRFRSVFESVHLLAILLDESGRITFCNEFCQELTGYSGDELLGRDYFTMLVPPETREARRDAFLKSLEASEPKSHSEDELVTRGGERRFIAWSNTRLLNASGRFESLAALGADVTEARRAEHALRESEERFALALLGANDGIWDWNLRTNRIFLSERWHAMLGAPGELGIDPEAWLSRVHPEEQERLRLDLARHLEGKTPHFENEHRLRHESGEWRWMLSRGLVVRDASGRATRMAGSQTDITERKAAEARLRHDAMHDALTGLPNRAYLMDLLRRVIARRARRPDDIFAVMFLDLDRFKVVNDSLGHVMGDQLLVMIARRLEQCLRPGDVVARLGGDEFTVVLEGLVKVEDAIDVAERVHLALARPFPLGGEEVFTAASIGIAFGADTYRAPEEVLRDADTAMYRAKAAGRGRHEIFDATMHQHAVDRLQLENDLRRAVDRAEFRLVYQPIVDLETGRLTGFEALARWAHPTRGLVMPGTFIPALEETGLILQLCWWTLKVACRQLSLWRASHPCARDLTISVNASARQFLQPNLVEQIEQVLLETGLVPSCLSIEVLESVMMENAVAAAQMLRRLRALGVHVMMDDFGTGYSSLSYLHRFEFDTLKIDRSFVSGIEGEAFNSEIVRTILLLASNLGKGVIAEGVETVEQADALRGLGCRSAQGYFFARPLSPEDAEAFLLDPGHGSVPRTG